MHRDFNQLMAKLHQRSAQPKLFIAHQHHQRPIIIGASVINRDWQCGANDPARPNCAKRHKVGLATGYTLHIENGAQRRPHSFSRKRVGTLADQNYASGTNGVRRAHHRSQIAGVAYPVERHPNFVGPQGDALQIMPTLGKVDAVVTDPP